MRPSRILAVDWSGALRAAQRKIWLCEVVDGAVTRLESGRGRAEIAEHLIAEASRDPDLLVGLDFAFSFPIGFLEKRAHREVETVWEEAESLGEKWLAHCPFPFWGKPGRRKPALGDRLYRRTELAIAARAARRPMSVFQIGGAGAVGVGSIRGMPILRRLRAEGFSIWPFHELALPAVVEIWPRLYMGPVKKTQAAERASFLDERHPDLEASVREDAEASDDAFDALVSALYMERHRWSFALLARAADRAGRLEGEIWCPD